MLQLIREQSILAYLLVHRHKATVDGWVSRLYHRATVSALTFASFLLGAKQYFGEPIHCNCDGLPVEFINPYCWVRSTFTVRELVDDRLQEEVAHPGIGYYDERVHTKIYHRYYQWVSLFFIVAASSFYLPRYAWKYYERRRMEELTGAHLMVKLQLPGQGGTNREQDEALLRWLALVCNHFRRDRFRSNMYLLRYCLVQMMNPLIVVLQIYVTDLFLSGRFLLLGPDILWYSNNSRGFVDGPHEMIHPLELTFPKVVACTFKEHGPSGSMQQIHALCLLPLNNLNEKLFGLLWFWYAILLTASAGQILLAVLANVLPCGRRFSLSLATRPGLSRQVSTIVFDLSLGQLFQLLLIKRNVTEEQFDCLVEAMAEDLANPGKEEIGREEYGGMGLMRVFKGGRRKGGSNKEAFVWRVRTKDNLEETEAWRKEMEELMEKRKEEEMKKQKAKGMVVVMNGNH